MAGGGSLGGGHKPKRGKAGKRKQKKRIGFVLDMTPLVDITFLLLTFFMFTTTMAQPQVMQMSVPPEDLDVKVKESALMSFYVDKDGSIYFFRGTDMPEKVTLKDVKNLATRETLSLPKPNDMITVLKVSGEAPYGLAVSILDELNLAEVTITQQISKTFDDTGRPTQRERRFTIGNMEEADFKKLEEGKGGAK